MATITKTFTFDSDMQGWVARSGGIAGSSATWRASVGNPGGCLSMDQSLSGDGTSFVYYQTTWEGLGVPSGSTVTAAQLTSTDEKIALAGTVGNAGPYLVYADSSGSPDTAHVVATLLASRQSFSDESSWTTRSGSSQSVTSTYQPSATPIWLRISNFLGQSGNPGTEQVLYDNVSFQVTYTPPSSINRAGSASLTPGHPLAAGISAYVPNPAGSAGLSRHPLVEGAGSYFVTPIGGTGAVSTTHPVLSGAGGQGLVFHGGGSLSASHPGIGSEINRAGAVLGLGAPMAIRGVAHDSATGAAPMAIPGVDPGMVTFGGDLAVRGGLFSEATGMFGVVLASQGLAASRGLSVGLSGSTGTAVNDGPRPTLSISGHVTNATGSFPMVIPNDDPLPGTAGLIPIVARGGGDPASTPCSLSVANSQGPTLSDDVGLAVSGDGVWPGFSPRGASLDVLVGKGPVGGIWLNLINRDAALSAPCFVAGHPGDSASATMAVSGDDGARSSSVSIAMPNVSVPTPCDGGVELAVPGVVGAVGSACRMAVAGWSS